jgi:prepilin-type processing-associated H-X9-DG protein
VGRVRRRGPARACGRILGRPAFWVNATTKYGGSRAYNGLQDDDTAGRQTLAHGGDKGLLICPEANGASPGPTGDTVTNGYFMLWGWDPAGAPAQNPVQRKTFWCYGFNTQLDGGVEDRNVGYRVIVKTTSIRSPSNTALIIEKIMSQLECSPSFATSVGQSEVSWKEFTTRHDGGGFILFVDGHVGYAARRSGDASGCTV